VSPVPAGAGMPGSIAGSPAPGTAAEAARRRSRARENPAQLHASCSTGGAIDPLSAIGYEV